MKKLITALAFGVAASASFANDFTTVGVVCAAGNGTAIGASVTTNFVKTTFTPKCSANTQVGFIQDSANAAVGSVSVKGNQVFGGHTNGGAVASTGAYSGTTDTAAAAAATGAASAKLLVAAST